MYKMTSRDRQDCQAGLQQLKMLIVPSLLFAISFLTQVAVFAAPLPLNDLSINARGDDVNTKPGTFTWINLFSSQTVLGR